MSRKTGQAQKRKFRSRHDRGAGLLEYALVVGLIAVIAIAAVAETGQQIKDMFSTASITLAENVKSEAPVSQPVTETPPPAADDVDPIFVGTGDYMRVSNVDSLDFPINPDTQTGDLLVAVVAHRDSPLSVPAGWTIEATQRDPGSYWATTVVTKTYDAADGFTAAFPQSTTQTYLGQIYSLRGDGIHVRGIESQIGTETTHAGAPVIAGEEGSFLISTMHEAYAYTSGDSRISGPAGWTQTTPISTPQNRLAIVHRTAATDGEELFDNRFTTSPYSGYSWASLTVQIDDDYADTLPTPPADKDPIFIGQGAYIRDSSDNNPTFAFAAGTQAGDYVVATVINHTSGSPLTAPTGWDLIHRATDPGGYWDISAFAHIVTAGDSGGVQFAAAGSTSLSGQTITLRGDNIGLVSTDTLEGSSSPHTAPGVFATDAGAFVLSGVVEAYSSSANRDIAYEGDWIQTTPVATPYHRMSLAYQVPTKTGARLPEANIRVSGSSTYSWHSFALQFDEQ